MLGPAAVWRAACRLRGDRAPGGLAPRQRRPPRADHGGQRPRHWHVLLAAEAAGVKLVICFSSAQVLGIAEGERLPDYFPVTTPSPARRRARTACPRSLAEDLCEGFTARTGIATVCPRPVGSGTRPVLRVEALWRTSRARNGTRSGSTARSWTRATSPRRLELALSVPLQRAPPGAAVRRRHRRGRAQPGTRRAARARGTGHRPAPLPGRSVTPPLIDCRVAETLLGWKAAYRWSGRGKDTAGAVSAADPPRPARPPTP